MLGLTERIRFKFTFKGIPRTTHCYQYSGLSCWYNKEQTVWIDFKECNYNLHEWDDRTIGDILLYHINLAVIHGLIDQNMFYGECKNEDWDPLYIWNIKLILGLGMGDYQIHTFNELFQYQKYIQPQSIMAEHDFHSGKLKIPYHYHHKDK